MIGYKNQAHVAITHCSNMNGVTINTLSKCFSFGFANMIKIAINRVFFHH